MRGSLGVTGLPAFEPGERVGFPARAADFNQRMHGRSARPRRTDGALARAGGRTATRRRHAGAFARLLAIVRRPRRIAQALGFLSRRQFEKAIERSGVAIDHLVRVADGGVSIEGEVWRLPAAGFGTFVAAIPAPMAIGTVTMADGSAVSGFLVEPIALENASDISRFGGWRRYLAASSGR